MHVNPRDFPITMLLEFLRERFQEWVYERKETAATMLTILSKTPEDNFIRIYENSRE